MQPLSFYLKAPLLLLQLVWVFLQPRAEEPEYTIKTWIGEEKEDGLHIAFLGDSTTVSVGVKTLEESMPYQAAIKIARETKRSVFVQSFGVSGAKTSDVLEQAKQLQGERWDAVVIEVGSNDATHFASPVRIQKATKELLETVRVYTDGPIVLGSAGALDTPLFPKSLRHEMMRSSHNVRAAQKTAAEDVIFVDVAESVRGKWSEENNSSDQFHPASSGYELWAEVLVKELVTQLQNLPQG